MRITIVGPGAIGCLFGTLLTEADNDVFLLDKDPERALFISQNGIRIDDERGQRTFSLRATADPDDIGTSDLVCICVKSYDTLGAVEHSLSLIKPDTVIVSLQNGLGNAEQIAELAGGGGQVVCVVTSHGATGLAKGHVRHAGTGITTVAPFDEQHPQPAAKFAETLARSRIEAELLENAAGMIWSKLIVNAAINPVTAVWDIPNGKILDRPDLKEIAFSAAGEAAAVAHAKDIRLLYDDAVKEVEKVCRRTRHNISSMLQDMRRRKRTEIDAITGAIVKEAHGMGIEVPVNEMLLEKVGEKQSKISSSPAGQ